MTYWKPFIALLLALGLLGGGFYAGHHVAMLKADAAMAKVRADDAQALAKAEADARDKEQLAADTLASIQQKYEKDRNDAQAQYEKDVADLRAGNLRLRKQWQCPADAGMPGTSPRSGQPDAAADQRAADAANLVRIARDADDQIRALQQIVITDRSMK